jgi:soluble lytic murein transglycosylase-like protein
MRLRHITPVLGLLLLQPTAAYAPPPPYAPAFTREAIVQAHTYGIEPALAREIIFAATAEGVPLRTAFRLVRKESNFRLRAVGQAGEIGLLQIKLSTARHIDTTMTAAQLFHPRTNLRIGLRYAAQMHRRYGGDWTRALTAYNRGPGVVDTLQAPHDSLTYANSILH